ncbi:cation:proton antiporter [Fontivita pretiosa]|uniref:cation:proton antiporter domain-containing protein n=1 Tax=Fontivita pretiosa TaxID=2989684 RepID=UPI003D1696EF
MHGYSLILTLLLQLALILALSRFMGWFFGYFRQPQVMGEMIAGIMLGPSLLGWLAPGLAQQLFPPQSVPYLSILSQVGVIFFLFLIGLELDPKLLKNRGHTAVVVSHVSIVAPFLLGAALTLYLYPRVFNDAPYMKFTSVALFMGAAMSVTAFPVLARILTERNLHKTNIGAISITCAAVDDVTAWCMLAFVVGIARADGLMPGLRTAGMSLAYVAFMFFVVRPFLRRLQSVYERQGRLSQNLVAVIFLLTLMSAYTTEAIGIHALFGAFLMGAIMPKGTQFVRALSEKLEDYTVIFLLPIFFAYTGLRTQIGLLNNVELWFDTVLIILVACLGKFGGSALAGRACGLSWSDASTVGILMNTRGLMELVILNIGLQEGVITSAVFAMMVIMALVTTAMTTPVLHLIFPTRLPAVSPAREPRAARGYTVLIPVSLPESGPALAHLAAALVAQHAGRGRALALHLRRPSEHEAYRAGLDDSLADAPLAPLTPLMAEASKHKLPVEPISFVSSDVAEDIAAVARARDVDLVLMGFHKPVFSKTILGGIVHRVLQQAPTDVAILVDRGLEDSRRILVPYLGSAHDRLAMELAARLARATGASVTVLHVVDPTGTRARLGAKAEMERVFHQGPDQPPVTFRVVEDHSPVDVVLREGSQYDLVVVGLTEEWGLESKLIGFRSERLARELPGSLLIVRKGARAAASADSPADITTAAQTAKL